MKVMVTLISEVEQTVDFEIDDADFERFMADQERSPGQTPENLKAYIENHRDMEEMIDSMASRTSTRDTEVLWTDVERVRLS